MSSSKRYVVRRVDPDTHPPTVITPDPDEVRATLSAGGSVNAPETRARQTGAVDRQEEFVLRTLEERDVCFVRLWFTDVLGYLKSVAVAPAELEGAFAEGIGFDGSAVEGFARVYEADMLAKPDPSTFQLIPIWSDTA